MSIFDYNNFFWSIAHESDIVKPNHISLHSYIIQVANLSGWPEHFGLNRISAMQGSKISNHKTYSKVLSDLFELGIINIIQESKNQFTSTIISLNKVEVKGKNSLRNSVNNNQDALYNLYTAPTIALYEQCPDLCKQQVLEHCMSTVSDTVFDTVCTIRLNTNRPIDVNTNKQIDLETKENNLKEENINIDPFDIDLDLKEQFPICLETLKKDLLEVMEDRPYIWEYGDMQNLKQLVPLLIKKLELLKTEEMFKRLEINNDGIRLMFQILYYSMDDFDSRNFNLNYMVRKFNRFVADKSKWGTRLDKYLNKKHKTQ